MVLDVYGYMKPLLFITVLLSLSVLCVNTNIAARGTTNTEPPFVSDHTPPVKVVKPVYPPAAWKAGVGGVVNLAVVVGKDGRVENGKVMNGPTHLRQAALDAVKEWEWEPFLLNSSPIRFRTRVTLRFDIHNKTTTQEWTLSIGVISRFHSSSAVGGKMSANRLISTVTRKTTLALWEQADFQSFHSALPVKRQRSVHAAVFSGTVLLPYEPTTTPELFTLLAQLQLPRWGGLGRSVGAKFGSLVLQAVV